MDYNIAGIVWYIVQPFFEVAGILAGAFLITSILLKLLYKPKANEDDDEASVS